MLFSVSFVKTIVNFDFDSGVPAGRESRAEMSGQAIVGAGIGLVRQHAQSWVFSSHSRLPSFAEFTFELAGRVEKKSDIDRPPLATHPSGEGVDRKVNQRPRIAFESLGDERFDVASVRVIVFPQNLFATGAVERLCEFRKQGGVVGRTIQIDEQSGGHRRDRCDAERRRDSNGCIERPGIVPPMAVQRSGAAGTIK